MGAVLIGMIGIAVDFTRAQSLRTRMQNAADGAALVAERTSSMSMSDRTAAARAFFDAEMGDSASSASFVVILLEDGGHRVEARLPMPVSLARIIRNEDWDIEVAAEAQASASPPIEVALVLDNTGSMASDMQDLRDAAEDLATYLMSIDGDSVSVGLVPFVAQVNIGTGATQMSWMDTTGQNPHHGVFMEGQRLLRRSTSGGACTDPSRFPTSVANGPTDGSGNPYPVVWVKSGSYCYAYNPTTINIFDLYDALPSAVGGWRGCVEARPPPYDITDVAPSAGTPATRFVPYFATDEGGDDTDDNNWLTEATNLVSASNTSGITYYANSRTHSVFKYRSNATLNLSYTNPEMRGPQRGCPTPIVPLTTNDSVVIQAIRDMRHQNGGGTNQAEGLAWGWRVLSPTPPFTQGRDPDVDEVRKVLVMMTDGENTSINNGNATFASDYSSYQYRRLWTEYQFSILSLLGLTNPIIPSTWQRLGISGESSMVSYINTREETLCDNIKADGVVIYTIQFRDASTANRNRLRNCATSPDHFFSAANAAQLNAAFQAIGTGIGQLRLTR